MVYPSQIKLATNPGRVDTEVYCPSLFLTKPDLAQCRWVPNVPLWHRPFGPWGEESLRKNGGKLPCATIFGSLWLYSH